MTKKQNKELLEAFEHLLDYKEFKNVYHGTEYDPKRVDIALEEAKLKLLKVIRRKRQHTSAFDSLTLRYKGLENLENHYRSVLS